MSAQLEIVLVDQAGSAPPPRVTIPPQPSPAPMSVPPVPRIPPQQPPSGFAPRNTITPTQQPFVPQGGPQAGQPSDPMVQLLQQMHQSLQQMAIPTLKPLPIAQLATPSAPKIPPQAPAGFDMSKIASTLGLGGGAGGMISGLMSAAGPAAIAFAVKEALTRVIAAPAEFAERS